MNVTLEFKIQDFKWDEKKIAVEVERSVGKGIAAAAIFLADRIREFISIPTPKLSIDRLIGVRGGKPIHLRTYRQTVRATPGAPPRRLSGALKRSINWIMLERMVSARIGVFGGQEIETRVRETQKAFIVETVDPEQVGKYARKHEFGSHPFIMPMVEFWQLTLEQIIGDQFGASWVQVGAA